MNNTNTLESLQAYIILLEQKKEIEIQLLKEEIVKSISQFDSQSLIVNSLKDFVKTSTINSELVDSTISYTAGVLTKRIAFGNSNNPIKNLLGTMLQIGISSLVSKNSLLIKKGIGMVIGKISKGM